MNIGFGLCGSFCTFDQVFPIMRELSKKHTITPIISDSVSTIDSRFGSSAEHFQTIQEICHTEPFSNIAQVEPFGPKKLLDILILAPCTGNTLAKLAHSIADTPITMAAKSHLRNARPILIAISTNDALAGAAENIGKLLARKHYYFVPFRQDDPYNKPTSIVANFQLIPQALEAAMEGRQIQPILL